MSKAIHHLGQALTFISEHPLWAVLTGLAGLAVTLVGNVVMTTPQFYSDQERNRLRFERYKHEDDQVDPVFRIMGLVASSIAKFSTQWQQHFAGKQFPEPADEKVVESTYLSAAEAKRQCSVALAVLRGLGFENEGLQRSRSQFLEAIEKLESAFAAVESFLEAHGAKNGAKVSERLPAMRTAADSINHLGLQLLVAAEGFGPRAKIVVQEHSAEIHKETIALELQRRKEQLAAIAVVYLILYVFGVGVVFVRSRGRKQLLPTRSGGPIRRTGS